jgi:hypothetical protein
MAALLVMTTIREMELSNAEIRVNNLIAVSESNARLKQCAAFYIQGALIACGWPALHASAHHDAPLLHPSGVGVIPRAAAAFTVVFTVVGAAGQ